MKAIKRGMDIVASLTGLIIAAPILIIVALLIKFDSKGPVFFCQERVGLNGKFFKVIKFRTMIDNAVNIGSGIMTDKDDPRITKVGKLLRKASIDEIPQLINILKGDMSLVGPRPVPVGHFKKYTDYEKKRLAVRPGITGWAQVNGRNNLTWAERIEKDIWYVNNMSIVLDIKIILKTVRVVLLAEGVYSGRYKEKVLEMNKNINNKF